MQIPYQTVPRSVSMTNNADGARLSLEWWTMLPRRKKCLQPVPTPIERIRSWCKRGAAAPPAKPSSQIKMKHHDQFRWNQDRDNSDAARVEQARRRVDDVTGTHGSREQAL